MIGGPDAAGNMALAASLRRPVTFCYLDIAGDPVRVTNAPYSFSFAGTGDEDLDGFTFDAVDNSVVSVSAVRKKDGGTDTVTLELSGLPGIDAELLEEISTKALYQGRDVRLWKALLDPRDPTRILSIWGYYTGVMSVPKVVGDQTSQTISLDVESYLAFFGEASNRTYLDQASFDPGDRSAELAIAIANGASKRT
ncbi:hypothetical protein [Sphingomonas parapaucimobilis]|uniref:Uncharacterized protein n=1 Tax=Sphingomonas parapaucimobilis NBRC 15100 TaxID=1219049 RepID=A0A0A1W551_9SPHN|nr:hypothetical protein [Sphingomonas parapaucimobilis]GAM00570.1 hypothetical protein SP5_034_01450 [Sphingomonas parapaucimobilis NBRC 15100]